MVRIGPGSAVFPSASHGFFSVPSEKIDMILSDNEPDELTGTALASVNEALGSIDGAE